MSSNWNQVRRIEAFLKGQLSRIKRRFLEHQLQNNPSMREQLKTQKKAYRIIRLSGRRRLKKELKAMHKELWEDPQASNWRQQIKNIFS